MRTLILTLLVLALGTSPAAIHADSPPPPPKNPTFTRHWETNLISWEPVSEASHFQVLHTQDPTSPCNLGETGREHCSLLADNLTNHTFHHQTSHLDPTTHRYYVSACNQQGNCSAIDRSHSAHYADSSPAPLPQGSVTYILQDHQAIITWPSQEDASHFSITRTPHPTTVCHPSPCPILADHLTGTSYTASLPPNGSAPRKFLDRNHYLVSTCNAGGCSKPTRAVPTGPRPARPPKFDLTATPEGISIQWQDIPGATRYHIFHAGPQASTCQLNNRGIPVRCTRIHTTGSETTYLHTKPHPSANHYWMTACNQAGCTHPRGPGQRPRHSPTLQDQPPKNHPAFTPPSLQLSKTTVHTGEEVYATLAVTNSTPENALLSLTIETPHGWSVTATSPAGACVQSLCTTSRITPTGLTTSITASLIPNNRGRATITGRASSRGEDPAAQVHTQTVTANVNVISRPAGQQPRRTVSPTAPAGSCTAGNTSASTAAPEDLTLITAFFAAFLCCVKTIALRNRPRPSTTLTQNEMPRKERSPSGSLT